MSMFWRERDNSHCWKEVQLVLVDTLRMETKSSKQQIKIWKYP